MLSEETRREMANFIRKKASKQLAFTLENIFDEFGTSKALYFLIYFINNSNNIDTEKFFIPLSAKLNVVEKIQEIYEHGFMKINSCSSFFKEHLECKVFYVAGPFTGRTNTTQSHNSWVDNDLLESFFKELETELSSGNIVFSENEIDLFYGV